MSHYIPEEIINDIRSRCDIHDIISNYIPLKKNGNRYKALCPFHNEKTPSFIVSPERQTFHCFGCGKGGNVFTFIMEKESVDFPEAARILASRCGIFIPENYDPVKNEEYKKTANQREKLYSLHKTVSKWYSEVLFNEIGKEGLKYLYDRNITKDVINKFKIGFAPNAWDSTINFLKSKNYTVNNIIHSGLAVENEKSTRIYDRFRNRIIFPIWNDRGDIVAFSSRTIEENPKGGKYINSPETKIFKKSRILYALPLAKNGIKEKGYVVLCEGQIDTIAFHRTGFDNTVAPQGTAFTDEQAQILKRYTDKIYICFDADTAGINATLKAIDILLEHEFDIKIVKLPDKQDPDSIFNKFGKETLVGFINNSLDFLDFLLTLASKDKDLTSPYVKNEIAKNIIDKLSKIKSNIIRTSYASILADKLNIQEKLVLTELKKIYNKNNCNHLKENTNNTAIFDEKINPIISEAERTLLELSIIDGTVGRKLDEELPVELISNSIIGKALNLTISLTVNGEWENITNELSNLLNEYPDSELSRALTSDPDYSKNFNKNKAVNDCIRSIKLQHNKNLTDSLFLKLKSVKDTAQKKEMFAKITNLQKEKRKLLSL
ncbi:MAG TPA: DNA primase [Victivallales bacterium]|nr:DNA primase [Victivallales bacterium]